MSFNCGKVFHCMKLQTFVYSSLSWWVSVLYPYLGFCELCCHNIYVDIFAWTYAFSSHGYIPRSGIATSYAHSILKFSWNCHTVFLSGCIFYFHQPSTRVLISSHLQQYFLLIAILLSMKCYLMNLNSPITNKCGHLFMCLSVTCNFFGDVYWDSLPIFK